MSKPLGKYDGLIIGGVAFAFVLWLIYALCV